MWSTVLVTFASPIFTDARVQVYKAVVGTLSNNVFIVRCSATGESVLIDAANEAHRLLNACRELSVKRVLTTHGHWDHIGAAPELHKAGYPVGIGAADAHMLDTHDFLINDGDIFNAGELRLRALHTPGHTPGSTCFALEGAPLLFTGDTLFPGGPGATRFADSSFDDIIESIEVRLFGGFTDDTIVLPGHGDNTTIGIERPHLADWIGRGW